MIANIIWKAMKALPGIVGAYVSGSLPIPRRPMKSRPPMIPHPFTSLPNASVKPNSTQVTLTSARMKMLCMIVLSTFLRRTRPP